MLASVRKFGRYLPEVLTVVVCLTAWTYLFITLLAPDCLSDDGSGAPVCVWYGDVMGNRQGGSFVALAGFIIPIP